MHVNRITNDYLEARIDPAFYHPKHLHDATKIQRFPTASLDSLRKHDVRLSYGVLKPKEARNTQYRMIRIQDFCDPFVNANEALGISEKQFNAFRRSECVAGDIIIAIGGYVGRVAIIPPTELTLNINQHIARFRPSPLGYVDTYFLISYLSCNVGCRQLNRYVSGSVQTGINLEDLRELPIPLIESNAQKYIGNKVRQAERLLTEAQRKIQLISDLHASLIPEGGLVGSRKRTRRIIAHTLTDRLDAHFYPAAVEEYMSRVGGREKLLDALCEEIRNGNTQPTTDADSVAQATVANLASNFISGDLRVVERPSLSRISIRPHDLAICNAAHNKDYIGREITYCDKAVAGVFPSTEVMVIRVEREKVPASYVRVFLLTEVGYLQIQSTIRGITAHSYPSDFGKIRIPIPTAPPECEEAFLKTDEEMLQAGMFTRASETLINAAKLLVEALIEGKITEDEIAMAQAQLEQGDSSGDRLILSRLYDGGIDAIEGKRLFDDLDAFYELLQEAEAGPTNSANGHNLRGNG